MTARALAAAALLALAAGPASAQGVKSSSRPAYGVLLLAHGGAPEWNREVENVAEALRSTAPVEVAFGMADTREIEKAVRRLEARKVAKIVAVPFFVNSASEVMDQTRFALGLSDKPSKTLMEAMHSHSHGVGTKQVKALVPLVMTPALDAHPLVAEILVERAKALSQDPKKETVFLVGHGPVDEDANGVWLGTMGRLAEVVKAKGKYKAVEVATLRDDAPSDVKAKAADDLRRRVRAAGGGGSRALVVPHLIARGGIERNIVKTLDDLFYAWDGRTLAPHGNLARWALETAAEGAKAEDMRMKPGKKGMERME